MGKLVAMWICRGGSVSLEMDGIEELDYWLEEMEKRGFVMWPGFLPDTDPKGNDRELADYQDREYPPVDFCPVEGHGSTKKWKDTRDGGFYCGHKVNDKWCGYAENDAGVMRKPPKTMPDYVQF